MGGAVFEGSATTRRGYALYDLGAYPALVPAGEGTVRGEVYSVSPEHLERLDRYEGCPDLYRREVIELSDGSRAEAYVMSAEGVRGFPRIDGGEFRAG